MVRTKQFVSSEYLQIVVENEICFLRQDQQYFGFIDPSSGMMELVDLFQSSLSNSLPIALLLYLAIQVHLFIFMTEGVGSTISVKEQGIIAKCSDCRRIQRGV